MLQVRVERLIVRADLIGQVIPFDLCLLKHRIEHLLYIAEYKRRQSAPGVKITRKNFGRDRRYPITNFFHTGPREKTPR